MAGLNSAHYNNPYRNIGGSFENYWTQKNGEWVYTGYHENGKHKETRTGRRLTTGGYGLNSERAKNSGTLLGRILRNLKWESFEYDVWVWDDEPWDPFDASKEHFAPDFKTLVNYMYENSPKEHREFAAYVLRDSGGNTKYYLQRRNENNPCNCNNSLTNQGYTHIKNVSYKIILQIHTHNSCNQYYEGPTINDFEDVAMFANIPVLVIGRTEISYLQPKRFFIS